jgi:hypothetical protein
MNACRRSLQPALPAALLLFVVTVTAFFALDIKIPIEARGETPVTIGNPVDIPKATLDNEAYIRMLETAFMSLLEEREVGGRLPACQSSPDAATTAELKIFSTLAEQPAPPLSMDI